MGWLSKFFRTPTLPEPGDPITLNSSKHPSIDPALSQIEALGGQIAEYTAAADKYFALAGTLSVAILAAALRAPSGAQSTGPAIGLWDAVILASPFALAFLLHYVAQLWTERAARVGVKLALEDLVTRTALVPYVTLERILAQSVSQRRLSVKISTGIFGAILLAVFTLGGYRAVHLFDAIDASWVSYAYYMTALAMLLDLLLVNREMRRAERIAFHASQERLSRSEVAQ